ncbi:MAG: hypothetical protein F4019_07400 [Rhodothermaceae bacterium]|nr:hypothetical protein [Rhodothermaceae bacterium]MYG45505.1 hypothetical protein [Rhodothermaceae bacterium]MYK64002.1 hypothetical protein [Rhodothermaceae bacterium]
MRQRTPGKVALLQTMSELEGRRGELLDQLNYLLDEIVSLRSITSRLHEAQITNTERGPSVKQCYGSIIMRDRNEILPALEKLYREKRSRAAAEVDWNRRPMEEILTEVEAARQSVIAAAGRLKPQDWTQEVADGMDVYQLLLRASHADADTLREVAQKLYRSHS